MCWYRIDENDNVVPCSMERMIQEEKSGGRWQVISRVGEWMISTVFLRVDHGFADHPLFFETMVFKSQDIEEGALPDRDCQRYQTKAEATAGHFAMVDKWMEKMN